jgi:hypothetical protein
MIRESTLNTDERRRRQKLFWQDVGLSVGTVILVMILIALILGAVKGGLRAYARPVSISLSTAVGAKTF